MVTNEMHFFATSNFNKGIVYKVRLPGITAMQLASAPGFHVARFPPEANV